METVELTFQDSRAELAFNRPHVLNAADGELVEDLHSALDELEQREGVRIVVVAGRGRAFCTGVDLKALAAGAIQIGWFQRWEEAMRRIEMLQAVTIARVQGYALGGGLQAALACDLRVAGEDAQFGLPAVLEALIPGTGTYRLPRYIGLGRARRMIVTGETVGAQEALEIGLADWIVPEAELIARTERIAQGVQEGSRTAQFLAKRLAGMSFEMGFDAFCRLYMDYQAQALASADHQAALERLRRKYQRAAESGGGTA